MNIPTPTQAPTIPNTTQPIAIPAAPNGRPCNTAATGANLARKFGAMVEHGDVVSIVIGVFTRDGKGVDMLHVEGMAIQTLIRLIAKAWQNANA
jgi:hypothetical protein